MVRSQLESVTRPEMTNKFTMREMITETLGIYQMLHEDSLTEEQAKISKQSDKKLTKTLKSAAQSLNKPSDHLTEQQPVKKRAEKGSISLTKKS